MTIQDDAELIRRFLPYRTGTIAERLDNPHEALDRLEEQLNTERSQRMEDDRRHIEALIEVERERDGLKEQLQIAQREIEVLTFAAENRWQRMEAAEEQLEALRGIEEYVASWVPDDFLPDQPERRASVWQGRAQWIRAALSEDTNPATEPDE